MLWVSRSFLGRCLQLRLWTPKYHLPLMTDLSIASTSDQLINGLILLSGRSCSGCAAPDIEGRDTRHGTLEPRSIGPPRPARAPPLWPPVFEDFLLHYHLNVTLLSAAVTGDFIATKHSSEEVRNSSINSFPQTRQKYNFFMVACGIPNFYVQHSLQCHQRQGLQESCNMLEDAAIALSGSAITLPLLSYTIKTQHFRPQQQDASYLNQQTQRGQIDFLPQNTWQQSLRLAGLIIFWTAGIHTLGIRSLLWSTRLCDWVSGWTHWWS